MENIEKALLQINETLREIRDIHKNRLDLEKMIDLRDSERFKGFSKMTDVATEIMGKEGQIRDEVMKMMGVKEEIDIDGIE